MKMKSGRAIIVEPLVLFHTMLDMIVKGSTEVKQVSPVIPTMKSEIPIQMVLPRNSVRDAKRTNEMVRSSKA